MSRFYQAQKGKPFLIYQLGTNNWQREGEYAPGSGILHEAQHNAYNATEGIKSYSMYPSEKQTPHTDPQVRVFKLDHSIPICESASPVSSYRWHSMSDEEFGAYRTSWDQDGVQLCYGVSEQVIEAFLEIFPTLPKERTVISPCGINQQIFHPIPCASIANVLSEFSSWHYEGSNHESAQIDGAKYDHVVVMVSKFAGWKRVPALLYAAKEYEKTLPGTATVIAGTGPFDAQKELQDLAFEELKLEHTYFVGPQPQPDLAKLYTVASVGVFPSYKEPFGMVLVECMSCGSPVIGCNSGGPRDFVDSSVGVLLEETEHIKGLGRRVKSAVEKAIKEDWKSSKGAACQDLVDKNYSVKKQCSELLDKTRTYLNI